MSPEPPDRYRNGIHAQEMIKNMLSIAHFQHSRAKTLEEFIQCKETLFPVAGQYADECYVPLNAPWHQKKQRKARVDFLIMPQSRELVVVSVKSQQVNGTAEGKLEYECQQLISTQLPAAMLVIGPIKGRDSKEGWTLEVLEQIWERVRYYSNDQILLFRTDAKIRRWFKEGLPVARQGKTTSQIFNLYCDLEP